MDATSKTALVIALGAVALLLLLFGGGIATGTMISGGMMGSASAGGMIWMWLPTLFAVVLYPVFGLLLSPVFAGAAMALSSVSVVTNALRLNRVKL